MARQLLAVRAHERDRLELAPDLLGDLLRLVQAGPVQHRQELLAAEPGDEVARAEPSRQDRAERPQHGVALDVAVALVEQTEVIEVEHDHGDGVAHLGFQPRPSGEQPGQRHVEVAPVPQAGQRVADGRVRHLGVQLDVVERQRDLRAR